MQCTLLIKGNYNRASALTYLRGGEEFFDKLMELIGRAQQEIHLQLYNLENDDTGFRVLETLAKAAKRGVKVYLLLDAYGSRHLMGHMPPYITSDSVNYRFFSPIVIGRLRTGRRLHHKILVVDGAHALIGSMNIADKYSGFGGQAPWLDFALGMEGPVCLDIRNRCARLMGMVPGAAGRATAAVSNGSPYLVRMVQNDWFTHKRSIYYNHREAIKFAEREIIIVSSYFIPSTRLIRLLQKAAARGVRINLYVQGLSDVPLARNATRYWYRRLFRSKANIFEFPRRVLHAKLLMVDERWMSTGSYNFNHISNYSSVESNIEVLDDSFCHSIRNRLQEELFSDAVPVKPEAYLSNLKVWSTFKWWLSHKMANFLMRTLFRITSKKS